MGNGADDNGGGVADLVECNEQFDSRRSQFWQLWVGPFSSIFKIKSCSCCEYLHLQNQKCKYLNGFIFGWCIDVHKFPWCKFFTGMILKKHARIFVLTWFARCWFQDLKLHCDDTFSPGDFQDCALMASVLARLWEQYLYLETISCVHAAESKVCGWNRSSTTIQTVCDGLRNPYKVVTLQHREKSQCMSVRILWYVLAQSRGWRIAVARTQVLSKEVSHRFMVRNSSVDGEFNTSVHARLVLELKHQEMFFTNCS